MILHGSVNDSFPSRTIYKIDKDSVSNEIYKAGKMINKTRTANTPGTFTAKILDLGAADWQNIGYQSMIRQNCDTSLGMSVVYNYDGGQKKFWIRQTSRNCYPESIKDFISQIFALFK